MSLYLIYLSAPSGATGFGFSLGTQQPTLGTQQPVLGSQQPLLGTQQPLLGTQQPTQVSQPSSTGFGFSLGLPQSTQPSQPAAGTGFSFGQVSAAGSGDTATTSAPIAATVGFGLKPPAATTQSGFTGFGMSLLLVVLCIILVLFLKKSFLFYR